MSANFSRSGRAARAAVPVHGVPLATIRARAHARRHSHQLQTIAASVAVTIGALGAGVGAVQYYEGTHALALAKDVIMNFQSVMMIRAPIARDLDAVVRDATFPVELPVGLAPGSRIDSMWVSPARQPSAIWLAYRTASGAQGPRYLLLDPTKPPATADQARTKGEIVLAIRPRAGGADAERVRSAMMNTTQTESLIAGEAAAAQVLALGDTEHLRNAEAYRAPSGISVLLSEQLVHNLAMHAARNEPLLDNRVATIDHMRYAHGEIDYANTRAQQSHAIAVSAEGVHVMQTVVQAHGGAFGCKCQLLYTREPHAHRIVILPLNPAVRPQVIRVSAAS